MISLNPVVSSKVERKWSKEAKKKGVNRMSDEDAEVETQAETCRGRGRCWILAT